MAHLGELRTTRDRARLTRFVKVASVVLGAKKMKIHTSTPNFYRRRDWIHYREKYARKTCCISEKGGEPQK